MRILMERSIKKSGKRSNSNNDEKPCNVSFEETAHSTRPHQGETDLMKLAWPFGIFVNYFV